MSADDEKWRGFKARKPIGLGPGLWRVDFVNQLEAAKLRGLNNPGSIVQDPHVVVDLSGEEPAVRRVQLYGRAWGALTPEDFGRRALEVLAEHLRRAT